MPYILSFYVPDTHLDSVKNAIFQTGAGKLGAYQSCAWQVKGEGQYMPLGDANPYKGDANSLSKENEYKIEIHCQNEVIREAVNAMKQAHPYEVPAYHVTPIADF